MCDGVRQQCCHHLDVKSAASNVSKPGAAPTGCEPIKRSDLYRHTTGQDPDTRTDQRNCDGSTAATPIFFRDNNSGLTFRLASEKSVTVWKCVCFANPDLVVDELAGQVHLLAGASDGEDPGVGVSGRRRVPLQLHVSSRLLVDALNSLPTCRHTEAMKQHADSADYPQRPR